jgi:hypothetical protein
MPIRTELRLRLPNSPGALARVMGILTGERVRIIALSLEPSGTVRLVIDNAGRATSVLSKHHVHADSRDVLCTVMAPQSIVPLLTTAAGADLNLEYAYASSLDAQGSMALVLAFEDTARAAAAIGL